MAEAKFHGIDRGWMQAQWRDCRDKAAQLEIFRDMVGRNVPPQEILDAVGEPEYCGPIGPKKRTYHSFTPEEDARIEQMANAGKTDEEIGDALGLKWYSVSTRIKNLRKRGVLIVREKGKPETEPPALREVSPSGTVTEGVGNGDLLGADALEAVGETLRALLDEEEMLCNRCRVVQDMIAAYRAKLRELLAMAGGGLTDGKDQI